MEVPGSHNKENLRKYSTSRRVLSSAMFRRVFRQKFIHVSKERAASIFRRTSEQQGDPESNKLFDLEDGGNTFLLG
jgi:hypothetical protein